MPPLKASCIISIGWQPERAIRVRPCGGKYDGQHLRCGSRRGRDERDAQFVDLLRQLSAQPGVDLENYCRLFESKGALVSGDITPEYSTLKNELIVRIVARLPELKVIFLARDPVERAWSQLTLAVHHGLIPQFKVNDLEAVTRSLQTPTVRERSYPSQIVARWRRHVGGDSLRVFFYDDLKNNPRAATHHHYVFGRECGEGEWATAGRA